jgi:Complex I intermediate-associated protein 30 (CIA30)
MGGISTGNISREMIHGRNANVLRGTVRLDNHGGFIQMATNLASSHSSSSATAISSASATGASASSSTTTIPTATTSWYTSTRPVVDASKYHGIELDVLCCGSSSPTTTSLETFNVQ